MACVTNFFNNDDEILAAIFFGVAKIQGLSGEVVHAADKVQ